MPDDVLHLPPDAAAVAALAASGLRYAVVDPADDGAWRDWSHAVSRGFHEPEPTAEQLAAAVGDRPLVRTVGVWDDGLAEPAAPIGTVSSWPAPLTLPGGEVTAWDISAVTVAPTHRRRGVARALLEAELRTAATGGLPLAALTVSEATIYGRYGFGPAAWTADIAVDARRAGWLGPRTSGRVQLVGRDAAMASARELFPRVRRATVGDVAIVGHRFDRLFGSDADEADRRARRFVRFDNGEGVAQGLAVYALVENGDDFTAHTVDVKHLATATDEAYRALWRYLLELDLVRTVRAGLRPVDEPLRWLVRDQRAVRVTEFREHLWVRVLDPVACFGGRRYGAAGRLGLVVDDPLGYAAGEWVLTAGDDGRGSLAPGPVAEGTPSVTLPVELLGSLLLGGVSAVVLARAGRLLERTAGDAAVADRLLRAERAPWLATWF